MTKSEVWDWLEEHHVLNLFERNMKKRGKYATIDEVLKDQGRSFIDFSFTWSNTKEGHDFWCNLQEEFYDDVPSGVEFIMS